MSDPGGIVRHYESCLEQYGDSHRGVDWPRAEDVPLRYEVMLGVVRPDGPRPATLLDFGCGAAHLYQHLRATGRQDLLYSGLDQSPKFVALSCAKFPEVCFHCLDVLAPGAELPRHDYVVMNGVFTEKRALAFEAMFEHLRRVVSRVFAAADVGIAFNVMSSHVDWERAELFHLPLDALAAFLVRDITRNFVFRNDYGLYEYTAYVYR